MAGLGVDTRGVVLQGCGHYIPEEAPNEICDLVVKFFNEP